jgi:hypothetical protein
MTNHPHKTLQSFADNDTGEWITLYHSYEDDNDQIVIDDFHVYVCGPRSPVSPPSPMIPPLGEAAASAQLRAPASSVYSDETPRPNITSAAVPLPTHPRDIVVVAPGLSSITACPPTPGVLTENQRLHLQSWLNACRDCCMNGIHRAAFPPTQPCLRDREIVREIKEGHEWKQGQEGGGTCDITTDTEAQHGQKSKRPSAPDQEYEDWETVYLSTPPGTPAPLTPFAPPRSHMPRTPHTPHTTRSSPFAVSTKDCTHEPNKGVNLAALLPSSLKMPVSSSEYTSSDPLERESTPASTEVETGFSPVKKGR